MWRPAYSMAMAVIRIIGNHILVNLINIIIIDINFFFLDYLFNERKRAEKGV